MCDIFISYRRTLGTKYHEPLCNKECEIQKERLSLTSLPIGSYAARILYDYLTSKNFSVFYDKESINFGEKYREKIKEEINQKARVFILILTKNVFDRCYDKEDHLYTEIQYALSKAEKQPNSIIIIPFIPDRMFDFKKDFNVSKEFSYLKDIEQYNAQSVDFAEVTFRDSMDRFCKQLEEILVPIYQDRFIDAQRREIATINGDSTHSKLTKKNFKSIRFMMTLSYFYTNNIPESIKLKDEILKLPCLKFFKVDVIDQHSDRFSQMEFLMSCHRDDVVIVDCTIPKYSEDKNERKNECSVFPILVAQVNMLDHVLVVSNNMLPLNITPQRQGYDSPRLEFNFTKEKQIKWIEEQIVDLHNLIKEGKHYNRVKLETYHDFSIYQEEMENMWSNSSEFRKSKEKGKKKVLISYRSSHIEEVKLYRDRYKKQHPEEVVRMIEPGILCSNEEALSPMRKWMLVFMLEEHIHDIDELIVYHTDDYTDSWWTCAELIMVFYNNYERSKDKQIKIKYYDIYNDTEKDINDCKWLDLKQNKKADIVLSKCQMDRLARLAANTRPGSMGPECMSNIDQMKMLNEKINSSNFLVRMIMRWTIKHMLLRSIPVSLSKENRNEMLRKSLLLYTNKEELKKYLADEVFDDTFWHSISYQTQRSTPAFVKQGDSACIDIDYFLKAPMSEAVNLSIEKILAFSENHKNFTIPTDTTSTTYIAKEITTSKYLWLATRMGQPTIVKDNIPGLERVPIFNIKKCE